MEENILPFSIVVQNYQSAYGNLFDDKGQRMIDTREDSLKQVLRGETQPYTQELFIQCLNIASTDDVYKLICDYPTLCLYRMNRCIPLPRYAVIVRRRAHDCHELFMIEKALSTYKKDPSYEIAAELFGRYKETSYAVSGRDQQLRYYLNYEPPKKDDTDRIEMLISKIERIKEMHSQSMTSGSRLTFDSEKGQVIGICDSLISAMYYQLYVNVFNNRTYKQCAHKGCNRWFLVKTDHPQTRCDEHMEARRRKREQYRKKIKKINLRMERLLYLLHSLWILGITERPRGACYDTGIYGRISSRP